jgi:hypothetical protein
MRVIDPNSFHSPRHTLPRFPGSRFHPARFPFRSPWPFADITGWSCHFCLVRTAGMKKIRMRCTIRIYLAASASCALILQAAMAQQGSSGLSPGQTQTAPIQPPRKERLRIPDDLPGADVAPLRLPPITPFNQKEREAAIKKLFPPLPPLGPPLAAQPGPDGQPLSLGVLQHMAQEGNPGLRQAALDIEAARGAAIQAGLYPNPVFG